MSDNALDSAMAEMADAAKLRARQNECAPEMAELLDRLLAFHDHTHPRHDGLFEDYQEECIANEMVAKASGLLDDIQSEARALLSKIKGDGE